MQDHPMSFTEHLGELRTRLFRSLLALAVAFFVAYGFHDELFHLLVKPVLEGLRAHGIYRLQALQVTEAILVHLQAALAGAIVLAVPYIFYQVWAFVAPGLLERERKVVLPVVVLVSAFFLLGVAFCYLVFLPMVVDFLVGFTVASGDVALMPTVERTFKLTTTFLLVFGLVFELPLLMFFLSALGVVTYRKFLKFARYFILVSFVVAAIFTPPDPLSQTLMAVPLCALYGVGVAFAWAGEALRKSGRDGLARAVVAAVFLVFAAAVGLAAWLWNRPADRPRAAAAVVAQATFAVRADPGSRLGRAVADERGTATELQAASWVVSTGPGGTAWVALEPADPCPVEGADAVCPVEGVLPADAEAPETLAVLEDRDRPVSGVALAPCAALLMPPGKGEGVELAFGLQEAEGGLVLVTLRFTGDGGTRAALTDWARGLREDLSPQQASPGLGDSVVGAVLAWSEGDLEVRQEDNATLVSAVTLPARAQRMAARLVRGALRACGPPAGNGGAP